MMYDTDTVINGINKRLLQEWHNVGIGHVEVNAVKLSTMY